MVVLLDSGANPRKSLITSETDSALHTDMEVMGRIYIVFPPRMLFPLRMWRGGEGVGHQRVTSTQTDPPGVVKFTKRADSGGIGIRCDILL